MALVLDATVGGAAANAYLDETAAQAIIDGVPNATAWTAATSPARQQALVYATQLLDALGYQGVKVATAQSLQWPRGAVVDPDYGNEADHMGYMQAGHWGVYLDYLTIPKRLKRACTMLALEILRAGSADVWGAESTYNLAHKKVDVLEKTFVDPSKRRYGLRALPSIWREVYPLTQAAQGRGVERA